MAETLRQLGLDRTRARKGAVRPEPTPSQIRGLLADVATGGGVPFIDAASQAAQGNYGQAAISGLLDAPPVKMAGMALAPLFAGVVGKEARSLPLPRYGEITEFSKPLPSGELFRELSPKNFIDMFSGGYSFGAPITQFAEVPEMALGQGLNKGMMLKVESEGLTGRPYLGKPGLEQAYLQKAGEFDIKEQPQKILKSVKEIWITPQSYKDLNKGQKRNLDYYLKYLEESGAKINRVDKLPNQMD